jgi:hypothetical protein
MGQVVDEAAIPVLFPGYIQRPPPDWMKNRGVMTQLTK